MATYFNGSSSEFQGAAAVTPDGMQTLFLMNPNYVPYSSDTNQQVTPTNLFFLNPAGNALNPSSLPHAPPHNYHHLLGFPPPKPTASDETHRRPSPSTLHGIVSSGVRYNSWRSSSSSIDHQNSFMTTTEDKPEGPRSVSVASQLGLHRPTVVSPRQGLSLSLSSSQQVPYKSSNIETAYIQGKLAQVPTTSPLGNSPSSVSVVSNGAQSVVLGSKYLRGAQELLDEVVNVGKVIKPERNKEEIKVMVNKEPVGSSDGELRAQRGPDLTAPQRQELQIKKAKLVTMLDEVEQKYRQYRHQMQTLVSSLEREAGFGAAKSYTGLASTTISKQFRCLKDAISGEIRATSKSLGEDDCLGVKCEGSRLRYVDYHIRQQHALQQLGMIQHGNSNAWRPQRGLPERAVSVLRAWLFEHFLHPYPKDSDKHMLAKQSGLTRSQVSNWFINARVRLWKPMVEEMYLEEIKGQEKNEDEEINANRSEQKESGCNSNGQQEMSVSLKTQSITSTTDQFSNSTSSFMQQTQFNLIGSSSSSDLGNGVEVQRTPKRPRNVNEIQWQMRQDETRESNNMMKLGDEERLFKDSFSYLAGTGYSNNMGEIGRFNEEQQVLTPRFHGNSVSLTLGLPQNFLSNHNVNSAWL